MTSATTTSGTPARVRFAPSPTGFLHLGGLRMALFDWLYARHTGGKFILRIEDTDQNRYDAASLDDVMRSLRWLGLDWDEGPDVGGPYGPYVQSERTEIYDKYVKQLTDDGHLYRSYMTGDELNALREEQKASGATVSGYDGRDRHLTDAQIAAYEAEGRRAVLRFRTPDEGTTVVPDLIRGDVEFDNAQLMKDPIVYRNGLPLYHLAMPVDDHHMQITHVLRGQEWLPSAPLHKQIFDALGWAIPVLVHAPVILDPSGKGKMSKRKKVVAGKEYLALVHEFIDAGYLPEAMFNFLTNVGWNFDAEREVFDREEAIERFDLGGINPAPAALPYDKLDWLNGVYIRDLEPSALKRRLAPFLSNATGIAEETLLTDELYNDRFDKLIPIIRERMKKLTEVGEVADWAFKTADAITYPDPTMLIGKKMDGASSLAGLKAGVELMANLPDFTHDALHDAFRAKAEALELKAGSFFAPFRVAITGKKVSPPLFESMEVLGRAEVLTRVHNAIAALDAHVAEAG